MELIIELGICADEKNCFTKLIVGARLGTTGVAFVIDYLALVLLNSISLRP